MSLFTFFPCVVRADGKRVSYIIYIPHAIDSADRSKGSVNTQAPDVVEAATWPPLAPNTPVRDPPAPPVWY